MVNDKNKFKIDDPENSNTSLTTSDLKYILDVNKKAIEIYIEVDKQNEKILETFEHFKEVSKEINDELNIIKYNTTNVKDSLIADNNRAHSEITIYLKEFKETFGEFQVYNDKMKEMIENIESKIEEIEKSLFRLILILGSTGVGLVITIVSTYFKK